jgi:hypothetical protein
MKKIYLVADEFATDYLRGGQLNDAALLTYLDIPIEKVYSCNLTSINPNDFYIIGNFIGIPETIKEELAQIGNYIILEKDYKFALIPGKPRHPLIWEDGVVPKDKIRWVDFYKNARKVICLTDWQQEHFERNLHLGDKLTNIHGSFFTENDLSLIEQLRETTNKDNYYAIQKSLYKNQIEAIIYCNLNNLKFRIIPDTNRQLYLSNLSRHKGLVFFPVIPETCSRIIIESKMLGLNVITNNNSGAYHEPWFELQGQELINHFRTVIIPNGIKIFKELINDF